MDRCPLKVAVTERIDGQKETILLPCAREHGHKGPCAAEMPKDGSHE